MNKTVTIGVALIVGLLVGIPLGGRLMPQQNTQAAAGVKTTRMP